MKIVFVSDAIYPYNTGGKEKRIFEITTRLAKLGHDVHIFTMKWWAGESVKKENGVTLHGICKLLPLYSKNKRRSIKQALYFAYKIFWPIFCEKFDCLEADQVPYFQLFPLKIATLLKRKKLIVSWLEVWGKKYWQEYLGWKGNFGYLVEKISVRLPDKFIAISELTKNRLIQYFNIPEHKISYIPPCGIDLEKFKNLEKKESFDCIYFGRLLNHKNVNILVEAIKVLKIKLPKIKCLIIGEGPERNKLEELVKILNLQNNIKFLGFIKEEKKLFSYISSAKVFVLPSTREGFGISVIEANACGIPAIVINHPENAAKDLVKEQFNGSLSKLSVTDLALKIENILLIQDLSSNFKTQSNREANKYDWQNIILDLEKCYSVNSINAQH